MSDCLDLFEELADRPSVLFGSHFPAFISFMLELAANSELTHHNRIKALDLIPTFAVTKSKLFMKSKLAQPILHSCFSIMVAPLDLDTLDPDEQSIRDYVVEVVDAVSAHLPSEVVFPIVVSVLALCSLYITVNILRI